MKRRHFNQLGMAALINSVFVADEVVGLIDARPKVKPLKKGDKVGLIAPATRVTRDALDLAISNIEKLGLEPYHSSKVLARYGSFGGSDEHRLSELHQMFADKSIKAVWPISGGYGVTRLLDRIDWKLIKKNPKPVMGFSDITALLDAIHSRTGLPCFHGPTAAYNFEVDYTFNHMAPIFGIRPPHVIPLCQAHIDKAKSNDLYRYEVIRPGKVRAPLVGGNLSLIAATYGTSFQMSARNKLLFLEDISEEPYRIDRMLTQLKSGGFFKGVRGIVVGVCWGCENREGDTESLTLHQVLKDRLEDLGIPVVTGFSFGHTKETCTFPLGVMAELDTKAATVTLLEDAYA